MLLNHVFFCSFDYINIIVNKHVLSGEYWIYVIVYYISHVNRWTRNTNNNYHI